MLLTLLSLGGWFLANVLANLVADAIWFHFDLDDAWRARTYRRRVEKGRRRDERARLHA